MKRLPYYRTDARREALLSEAQSWQGTPFRPNGKARGRDGGVDCAHYLAAVHAAAGACEPLDLPDLPVEVVVHWHEHHGVSRVLKFFEMPELRGRVERVDENEPTMIGDVAVLKVGQTEHHLAIHGGTHLYHVVRPAGVVRHSVRDQSITAIIRAGYRIMEVVEG